LYHKILLLESRRGNPCVLAAESADMKCCMDLVNAIVGMDQAKTASSVDYAVAKKILDNQTLQGEAAVKLIQAASLTANAGADELAAAATGLGASLDTYA
jgi:hypothetical protein